MPDAMKQVKSEQGREQCLAERDDLAHHYLTPNGRDPRRGDRAVCGHIKPDEHRPLPGRPRCVVCVELEGLFGPSEDTI